MPISAITLTNSDIEIKIYINIGCGLKFDLKMSKVRYFYAAIMK